MATVASVLADKGNRVVCVKPESTVAQAARLMSQNRIGAVIVSEDERVLGIFTERDVLYRVVASDRNPAQTHVRDVMTAPVACGTMKTTLAECRSVMTNNKLRHLPIIEDGRLVGIVSSGDIIAREVHEQQATIQFMHDYLVGHS